MPESLSPLRILLPLGVCGFLYLLRFQYNPPIKFRVFSFAELGFRWPVVFLWYLETFQFGGGLQGRWRLGHLGNVSGA